MSTALIYVRQSHPKDREHSVSPEAQEDACRRLSQVAACDQVEVYRDIDITGKTVAKRPSFQRVLARLQVDPPEVVAAYDQSRSFRNTSEALEFFALMERMPQVDVVFHIGQFRRDPVGKFSYTALAAAHTMEREMTGAKIAATYAHLNAAGQPTGMPPYGYRRQGRDLVVDDAEAEVVRRIFALCLEGRSTYRIAELLNAERIDKPRARTPYGWLPDTVVDILRNPAYVAMTGSQGRANGKVRGELIPARWEPIVPAASFQRVQEVLGRRQVRRGRAGRTYAYARLLVCSRCGEGLRAILDERRVYYQCRRDIAPRCPEARVREVDLDAWVEDLFDGLEGLDETAVELAREQARNAPRERRGQSVEGVEAAIGRLAQLFGWGHLTEDQYLRQRRDMEALREELARAEPRPDLVERIRGVGESWRRSGPLTRRRLLGAFFERLYTREGKLVAYVARREYRTEVEELVEIVLRTPAYGGKGGIRTLEGASNPLPA